MKASSPKECNELLAKAFNERNMKDVLSLFEEDAIFTDEKGHAHPGLQAIREAEQKVLDLKPFFRIETLGVTEFEDIAVLRSKWVLNGTRGKKPVNMEHNGIEVVRKQKDGSWKYIIDNPFYAD